MLRGRSHSGNVAAADLIKLGLIDALASDYLPSALLGAVITLVRSGTVGLPAQAWRERVTRRFGAEPRFGLRVSSYNQGLCENSGRKSGASIE